MLTFGSVKFALGYGGPCTMFSPALLVPPSTSVVCDNTDCGPYAATCTITGVLSTK